MSCELSGKTVYERFADAGKTIKMPKGATKIIDDYKLSRYVCYLILHKSDLRKEVVALGQTYFAI